MPADTNGDSRRGAGGDLSGIAAQLGDLARDLAARIKDLPAFEDDVRARVAREITADLTSRAVEVVSREVAYRFETELQRRVTETVAAQLQGKLAAAVEQLRVVPVGDINDAVEKAVDSSIARRLTSLLGGGDLRISVGAPQG